ncbi:hypothetical protein C7U89_03975 [Bradyrhizobium sp. WBOS4]|nr:hypothetical protein [Bradyrhizobium sp. WBOS8]MDD1582109.1 hypothetical protein [Bradyrhizobium sp. WBOS4]UUO47314.1 hypothetical protein DCM78_10495 [Bradyrhizobium sp. WBOS04]UUO60931.1 hypothetical protein DCM80_18235 [Bradyrhizobium sp. WBOS08]
MGHSPRGGSPHPARGTMLRIARTRRPLRKRERLSEFGATDRIRQHLIPGAWKDGSGRCRDR